MGSILTGIIVLVALIVLIGIVMVSRFRVAGPNEAFIITGRKGQPVTNPETGDVSTDLSGQKVVMGASVFVLPVIQKLAVLDLSSRQIGISVGSAVSAQGIKCGLEGVAIVKVGGTEDAVRASAQRFLGQQDEIESFTTEVLAGSLRAIVGRLSVEEIIKDRAAFAREVAEEAEASLTNQGLVLDTFQLQDIRTEGNYLKDLGRPESARAEKEAAIAEAIARREAEQARIKAEEEIAVAERELALRKAAILAETDAANADAEAAGPIAKAAKDQDVISAQEKVAVRQAQLKDRQLDTEVRKPADARRYAVEQDAEGQKTAAIRNAEAERSSREAAAEALRAEGSAEADAIASRGTAEANAMQQKAQAYEQYGEAAVIEMLSSMLPSLVREAAAPMGMIDKVTVISTDGASQLTKNVAGNVAQGLQLANDLLGIDLTTLVSRALSKQSGELSPPAPPAPPPESPPADQSAEQSSGDA
ncbi:MAG: flotillin family protein [Acidimicrobiia bacterium]|jgi:flotillin|nr:flotillin family protein [Acidimicrobiia bacterium]